MSIPAEYDDDAMRILLERAGDHDDDAWAELLHALAVRLRCEPQTKYARQLTEHVLELLALRMDEREIRAALTGRPKLVGKPKNTTRDEAMTRNIHWRVTYMGQQLAEATADVAKMAGLDVRTVEAIYRKSKRPA